MADSASQFATAVAPLRTTLEDLFEQHRQRADTHEFRLLDGSRAAIEAEEVVALSVHIGGWPIDDTLSLANLLIHAASDHFTAACRLIAMEEPVLYADKVLFRGGVEACARANWLLDPTIDARRRCARMLTARLVDLTARLDLGARASGRTGPARTWVSVQGGPKLGDDGLELSSEALEAGEERRAPAAQAFELLEEGHGLLAVQPRRTGGGKHGD